MDIKYTSDRMNTYMYYFLYPLIIAICVFVLFKMFTYGSYGLFIIIMMILFIYVLSISFISLLKLRYIEVKESSILIKKLNREEVLYYKDIEHVYDVKAINGIYMIIWYKDVNSTRSKVIYVKPKPDKELSTFSYLLNRGELGITKFIKERAIKENPNYLYTNKSSRWFLFDF